MKLYYSYRDDFRIITGRNDEYVPYDNDTVIVIGGTIFVDGTIYLPNDNDEIPIRSSVKKVFLLIPDKNSYRKIIKQLTATDSSEPPVIEVDIDLEDFGDSAFENAVFPRVKILEGVKSLGKRVFANCPNLTLVKLPRSLKEIGDEAFSDCTALVNIVIPSKVENVGNNVFSGCTSLEKIFYWAGANFVDKLHADNNAKIIPYYRFDLPVGVTITSKPVFKTGKLNYFAETIDLKDATGDIIKATIEAKTFTCNNYLFTFNGCDTFTVTLVYYETDGSEDDLDDNDAVFDLLPDLDELNDVELIAYTELETDGSEDDLDDNDAVFDLLPDLDELNDVELIAYTELETDGSEDDLDDNDAVFDLLPDLDELNDVELIAYTELETDGSEDDLDDNDAVFDLLPDLDELNDVELIACGTCGKNLTWTFDGDTLTISGTGYMYNYSWQVNSKQINSPWYINRTLIKSVVIEDGVISIGDYAFYKCTNLISVTIPNGVISIGDWAFYECTNLTSVTIPNGVKIIGEYAFYWCESLSSITIPDSVKEIYEDAFCSCKSLTNMTIPASVELFGVYVFGYCDKLEKVTFLCDLDKIPNGTFNSCRSLKSVRLPDGITEIAEAAFKSCTSLTGVEIPNGVTIINHDAFDNCKSLSSVRLPASLSKIGNRIFNRCKKLGRIYYKSGTPIANNTFKSKLCDGNKARLIPY